MSIHYTVLALSFTESNYLHPVNWKVFISINSTAIELEEYIL